MRIAIDLNDVVRDYSNNFINYYIKGLNNTFKTDNILWTTNDLYEILPFTSKAEYENFVYYDYPFELYGKCPMVDNNISRDLNRWITSDIDYSENDVIFVSPMEYELTIQSTYMFLAKIGSRIREVYMPTDSSKIWDKCDLLITANPKFFINKPEGKKIVKIEREYNENLEGDFSFKSLSELINNKNNTDLIFK